MARTLYLNDGSVEYIFAGMTEKDVLRKIIYERLGRDCEELFDEVTTPEEMTGDDYEKIADGYRTMLQDDLEAFKDALAMLDKPRLDKKNMRYHLQACIEELQKNL